MNRSVSAIDLRRSAARPPYGVGRQHGVDAALERGERQRSAACRRGSARCRAPDGSRRRTRTARRGRTIPTAAAASPRRPCGACAADAPTGSAGHRDRRSGTCSRTPRRSRRRLGRAVAVERDRHGAGGVREIPDDDRAGRVRGARDRRHVVHAAGAVVDVGQQHDGGRRRIGARSRRPRRRAAARGRAARASAVGDVEIGREVVRSESDDAPRRRVRGDDRAPRDSTL